MNNKLILRSTTSPFPSPYSDVVKGSVLSHKELDENLIKLKGEVIYTAITGFNSITLKKLNGNDLTISAITDDTFVTGGTFNDNTDTITLTRNDDTNITISGISNNFTTGLTFNNSTYILTGIRNDGVSYAANLITLASDRVVTGGTYNPSNGTATFTTNSGNTFNISGFLTGFTDTSISSFTYNGNILTITESTGPVFNVIIDVMTGLTVNGNLISNTISATTYQNLPVDPDIYVTGGTFNNSIDTVILTRNDGGNITITGITDNFTTGVTLNSNILYFDRNDALSAYTVDLSSLDTNDTFVTGSSFNPSTYDFTITRNDDVNITSNLAALASDRVVTGGTYNSSTGIATFTTNSGVTFNVTGFFTGQTDTFVTGGTYNVTGETITLTRNDNNSISITGITSGGDNIYTADGTIGAGRVATLTDELTFSGGQVNVTGKSNFGTQTAHPDAVVTVEVAAATGTGMVLTDGSTLITMGRNGSGKGRINISGGGSQFISLFTNGLTYFNTGFNTSFGTSTDLGAIVGIKGADSAGGFVLKAQNSSDVVSLFVKGNGSVSNNGAGSIATNTAFGELALLANTTGNSNVALGYSALLSNTTGVGLTAIGRDALRSNVVGTSSTAVGNGAMYNSTSNSFSTAFGNSALYNHTTSIRNTAIGYAAMQGAAGATGGQNVAVGWQIFNVMTTLSNSVGVGFQTGVLQQSGDNNVYIGPSAGAANVSGSDNTALGGSAFAGTGSRNTVIGRQAGGSAAGAYNDNVYLGYRAGYYETGSDKFFLDNRLRGNEALSRTNSLIYGVFNATTSSQTLDLNAQVTIKHNLIIPSGTNKRAGNVTLTGGTATVNNTTVTANTLILLTKKTDGGTIGTTTYTVNAGTSFTITSDSGTDTSTYTYMLIENS